MVRNCGGRNHCRDMRKEGKIGELQSKIMKEFPESSLAFRRQFSFADVGPGVNIENIMKEVGQESKETGVKIWEFISKENVRLNILTDSLDISSTVHKTYDQGDGYKFRDTIKFVIDNFIEITSIPIIKRIGLRYQDECPIPEKKKDVFKSYYNSIFPFNRFKIENTVNMNFRIVDKIKEYNLIYQEHIKKINNDYKLILDFDCFATEIPTEKYLEILDKLHKIVSDEFEKTMKKPAIEIMRGGAKADEDK